jgi:hypothetical protein
MIRSHDDLIRIEVIENRGCIPPVASDFSIINLPLSMTGAQMELSSIYNSPTARHVSLLLSRYKRKEQLESLQNVTIAEKVGFDFFGSVSIWYEKPSSCSNNAFLPVCETGYLFYKGAQPDAKATEWFGDGTSNATNLWNVSVQEHEPSQATYYQKFCWEVPLLLLSLAKPLEHRRFIYDAELTDSELSSLFSFVRHFNIGVQLYETSESMALHIIRRYAADYGDKK